MSRRGGKRIVGLKRSSAEGLARGTVRSPYWCPPLPDLRGTPRGGAGIASPRVWRSGQAGLAPTPVAGASQRSAARLDSLVWLQDGISVCPS